MADLFGYSNTAPQVPLTADVSTINWGGVVTAAVRTTVQYSQQVNRRRTIGNREASIWGSAPNGNMQIERLLTSSAAELFGKPGWQAGQPGTASITVAGRGGSGGYTLTAIGCVVSSFNVSLEAESLTCMDNVSVDFLSLQA